MTACETLPEPSDIAPAFPWGPLLLLSAGAFWSVTLELLPAGLLPAMSSDLAVGAPRIGLLVTVWALTVGVTTIPLSHATRRMGRPQTLSLALAVLGGATVLTALAPTYAAVGAARLVAAAGHGLFWSVLLVYAAALAPEGRSGRAIAVVQVGPILATVVGLPVGTWLAGPLGWRPVVGLVGAAMVVGAALLVRLLPADTESGRTPAATQGRDPTRVLVLTGALLGATTLMAHFAVFTFVAPLSTGAWGLGGDDVGTLLLVFGAAGAAGLLISGLVPDQLAQPALVAVVGSLAVTFGLLGVASDSVIVVHALVAVWGLLLGMLPPLLQARVIGVASPASKGVAGAVLVVVFNLGIAAGALLGGAVIDRAGVDRLLPVAACVAAVAAVGLAALGRWVAVRAQQAR
jgi:DHA1 family inner membrane transport protein